MEEVDGIILLNLRQIGTAIDDEVRSLKQLTTEALVEGCSRCINTINGNEELPIKLPPVMSARFRIATGLAAACKALGYPTEIGYNTFLYASETESRSLLMWLVERLPKEELTGSDEALGQSAALNRTIGIEVTKRLKTLWTPPFCKKANVAWRGNPATWHLEGTRGVSGFDATRLVFPRSSTPDAPVKKEEAKYFATNLPVATHQPPVVRDVPASLISANTSAFAAEAEWEAEWNSKGVMSGLSVEEYRARKRKALRQKISDKLRNAVLRSEADSKKNSNMMEFLNAFSDALSGAASTSFAHKQELQFTEDSTAKDVPKAATEEELAAQRESQLKELEARLQSLDEQVNSMENAMREFLANTSKLQSQSAELQESNAEAKATCQVRAKVIDMLPNADENIRKLQALVDSNVQRLAALAAKWEEHRVRLIDEYRRLKEASVSAKSDAQKQLEQIKVIREETKEVIEGAKAKEMLFTQLTAEYESMTKDTNRSAYTRRIMEIVKNIARQKEEIAKVLIDTRVIQKDINMLSEKLNRTFAVTDELIFKDAKKDEGVRSAYKHLAALHETCSALFKVVEETGSTVREIRDLEDQIETEQRKNMSENLGRIQADLTQIKGENATLLAQVKGVAAS
eukprot:m.55165 g.55165  ORF g.55165 m.55165 type:complete len:631 (+) comp13292_c0_seq1:57-1949(+)